MSEPKRTSIATLIVVSSLGLLIATLMATGCKTPPEESQPAPQPVTSLFEHSIPATVATSPATEPADAGPQSTGDLRPIVRLEGRDALLLRGAIGRANHVYRSSIAQPAAPSDNTQHTHYVLSSSVSTDPPIRCEIRYADNDRQATIVLSSDGPLPKVSLLAQSLIPMQPIRTKPLSPDHLIQSAMGPVSLVAIDCLYDPQQDWAIQLEGDVTCLTASDGVVIQAALRKGQSRSQTVLTLTSHPDYSQTKREPEPPRIEPTSLRSLLSETNRVVVWNQIKQAAHTLMNNAWTDDLSQHKEPEPLFVGKPLSMDQARFWASLIGLAGRNAAVGDAIDTLPAERLALLHPIQPPAPVRMVDWFDHDQPELWDLKVATRWGQWDVLGIFNWTFDSVQREIKLDQFGLDTKAGQQFAVFDVWEDRLVAITRQSFSLHVPPTGCRVVAIKQIEPDRPTLLGSNRHITQGATDLTNVFYDTQSLTMHGTSAVATGTVYELEIFVPEGEHSFEIVDVRADGASHMVRQLGPIRTVSFQCDQDRSLDWTITFAPSAQPFTPLLPPTSLMATQNTRGARLTWNARDDRAVSYRIYRNDELIAEAPGCFFRDDHVAYNTANRYEVTAVDPFGRESARSVAREHQTPIPANTNLTQLVPLSAIQDRLELGTDTSVQGRPLHMGGQRFRRGLGTHANARIRYFLGGGYTTFKGAVGIDDETKGAGSAVFQILGDGKILFTSGVKRGSESPQSFKVSVRNVYVLELNVTDAGDRNQDDHADWGNPYLIAVRYNRLPPKPPRHQPNTRPASNLND